MARVCMRTCMCVAYAHPMWQCLYLPMTCCNSQRCTRRASGWCGHWERISHKGRGTVGRPHGQQGCMCSYTLMHGGVWVCGAVIEHIRWQHQCRPTACCHSQRLNSHGAFRILWPREKNFRKGYSRAGPPPGQQGCKYDCALPRGCGVSLATRQHTPRTEGIVWGTCDCVCACA